MFERSKQQSMQQLLLAWLKYLAKNDGEKHNYKYSPNNTASFDVLADGRILSKALWEILKGLPSNFTRIDCTGLGRIQLIQASGNNISPVGAHDDRNIAWSKSKILAYRSQTEHQISCKYLLLGVNTILFNHI